MDYTTPEDWEDELYTEEEITCPKCKHIIGDSFEET